MSRIKFSHATQSLGQKTIIQGSLKRILYATDMSENAIEAACYALKLSWECDAHLTVVNVISDEIEEMSANMGYDLTAHYDEQELAPFARKRVDRGREALVARITDLCREATDTITDFRACPTVSIRAGETVEQILLEAELDSSDIIVVGAKSHDLLDKVLVGSVAAELVKQSRVPVVAVPLVHS